MAPAEIPTVDLRASEFSPDRELAMRTWAYNELQQKKQQYAVTMERDEKLWAERAAVAQEEQTRLRVEAVKRGEIWRPPPPRLAHPVSSASNMGYATGAYYYR